MSDPLLTEISRLRRENYRLRRSVRWLTTSRDTWRARANGAKWENSLHYGKPSTASTDLSPAERAEASLRG